MAFSQVYTAMVWNVSGEYSNYYTKSINGAEQMTVSVLFFVKGRSCPVKNEENSACCATWQIIGFDFTRIISQQI